MIAKTLIILCAQALLAQLISSQCISAYNGGYPLGESWNAAAPYATGSWAASPYAAGPYATATYAGEYAYAPATLAASNGGGLAITSASPIPPSGVAVNSENAYEGPLAVAGALPFLGAVAMEGPLPTLGSGAVTYAGGNGNVAIVNEDYGASYGAAYGAAYGAGPYSAYGAYSPAAEVGYGYAAAPLAYEAALAGPGYGYRGCGAMY